MEVRIKYDRSIRAICGLYMVLKGACFGSFKAI